MYYKLDEDEKRTMERAREITCTDYELIGDFVPVANLIDIIRDLICMYEDKEESYEDLERDLQDNYRPITKSEMYE